MEESYLRRESRLIEEADIMKLHSEEQINALLSEKQDVVASNKKKYELLEKNRLNELNRLKELHKQVMLLYNTNILCLYDTQPFILPRSISKYQHAAVSGLN